jgi:hypothetical protein
MPSDAEIAEGIGTLEAALQPVDERLAKMIILQIADTFPNFGERMSSEREANRAAAWLAANGDLPADLWQEAKLGVLRSDRKGMPSPGEFRAFVEPRLDRRRRELERLRSWQRMTPAQTSRSDRLDEELSFVATAARTPIDVVKSKSRELQKNLEAAGFSAHQARLELAEAARTTPKTPFALVALAERIDVICTRRRSPPPRVERPAVVASTSHLGASAPLSPSTSARTLRAVARQHRADGRIERAEQLEHQADDLEKPRSAA